MSVLCSSVRSFNRSFDHSQAVLLLQFLFMWLFYVRLFGLSSCVCSVARSINHSQAVLLLQFFFVCLFYVRLFALLTVLFTIPRQYFCYSYFSCVCSTFVCSFCYLYC